VITLLIALPLLAAGVSILIRDERAGKWLALVASGLTTLISLGLWLGYDLDRGGFQHLYQATWIPGVGVSYLVGLDGLSLPFVFLTALLTLLAVMTEWKRDGRAFFALFLLLQGALTGAFAALDLILFFFAFELVLIPMFFIIGIWGYEERRYAAMKFLLYSLVGSVLLLAAILVTASWLAAAAGGPISFDLRVLMERAPLLAAAPTFALLACLGFLAAFLIKLPAWPFHTWLPHAHTQAPTAGSMLLAGVLLKLGGYGIIRFNLALFPDAMLTLQPLLATLAVVGILYGGYVALGQSDLKRLIAYSSVNHMGFVLLGVASLTALGIHGAVYQMIAHGVITGLLFMLVGMLSKRTHTRAIAAMKGVYTAMPVLGSLLWLAMLGGAGAPGMAGFIGEVVSLMGAFANPATAVFAVLAVLGVLVNSGLMFWTIQRVLQGEPGPETPRDDLSGLELAAAVPLVFLALLWGLWPPSLSPYIDSAVQPILAAFEVTVRVVLP